MKTKGKVWWLCMLISLFILVSMDVGALKAQQAKEINYGIIGPYSGPAAAWGIAYSGVVKIAMDEMNGKDGFTVKGGDKYIWKLKDYDDKYVPSESAKAANRAILHDGVKFIYAPAAASSVPIRPIAEENKVIMWTSGIAQAYFADAPTIKYSFGELWSEYSYASVPWFKKNRGVKTWAVVNPDQVSGRNFRMHLENAVKATGGVELVGSELFSMDTTDFYPLLSRILPKNPDLIDTGVASPTLTVLLVKQIFERGYKGIVLVSNAVSPNDILTGAGKDAAEGVYLGFEYSPDRLTPKQKEVYSKFGSQVGAKNWFGCLFGVYDEVIILTKAIQAAGGIDPDKVVEELRKLPNAGLTTGDNCFLGGAKLHRFPNMRAYPVPLCRIVNGKSTWITDLSVPRELMD